MAEKEQFYSFEEALRELRLKEEELKRLVSEGEIRAFREGDTMRLRKADVENLKSELSGGEVVDLGDVKEELVFEDDASMQEEAGMATEAIANVETILEEDAPVEVTEELEIEELETETAEEAEEAELASTGLASAVVEQEGPTEGAGLKIALILTTLLLVLAIPLCLSASRGEFSSAAQTIAGLFGLNKG
ncbi:MAG: helix-turn-helix domain-containing protein [Planctomycetes bacterium]|nr:helix-turn-helix domain-containing protein [Planctomycetota bacterium]